MGSELRVRGVEVPDHITSIWSAQALVDAPEKVEEVHRAYIDAGAEVSTLNNYAVTTPLLARARMDDRLAELTKKAIEIAHRARDSAAREVRIAGSLPPLATSYRADEVGPDDEILAQYREMTDLLAPHVDLLLCETLSCAREARAAASAATESGQTVWLSWTLQGRHPDHLPSGEHLGEAFDAIADLEIDAFLELLRRELRHARRAPAGRRSRGRADRVRARVARQGGGLPHPHPRLPRLGDAHPRLPRTRRGSR